MSKRTDHDRSYAQSIEDMLLFLSLYDRSLGIPDPRFFDGAIFGWPSIIDSLLNDFGGRGHKYIDARTEEMRPIRGSIILAAETKFANQRYAYMGGRELSYEEKKRRLGFGPLMALSPKDGVQTTQIVPVILDPFVDRMMELRSIMVAEDGRASNVVHDTFYFRRHRWYPTKDCSIEAETALEVAVVSTWASHRKWSVAFRLTDEAPSARFFTDPTGIKDFLRFRDLPEGRSRRDALVHWVTDHWRQDRNDPEMELYVREHLRGSTRCHWYGMNTEIYIPPVDQARVEVSRVDRKKRAKLGEHRRKRNK